VHILVVKRVLRRRYRVFIEVVIECLQRLLESV